MEERLRQTCQFVQDKVFLGKLKKRLTSIYTFHLLFFCFLVKTKYYLMDRISNLPDELVARILSLLSLKEAVATSILSKRWRYAWASTMTLNFDDDKSLPYFGDNKRELQDKKRRCYVSWVDCVVKQHTGPTIEQFRACFDLDRSFTSSIDKWIQFAMEKSVKVLVLDFVMKYGNLFEDSYSFPHKLLGLEQKSPSNRYNIGFKSLKVLYFESVDVTGEVLEYFLSHCPVLERLSVSYAKSFVSLRVVGPSLRLKYLLIKHCIGLENVEIHDTNLVSFIHIGVFIDVHLSNVPLLVEAAISCLGLDDHPNSISLAFTQLSSCVYQLETLMLDIYDAKYDGDNSFPILPNLKHLELTVSGDYQWGLSHLSSFMKACPQLQRLVLQFEFRRLDKTRIRKAAKWPHHNLKVVELVGYRARANAIEHVMYLIENAVALEKIVIDPVQHWCFHHTGAERHETEKKAERKARNHAMHWLKKKKVPSSIEFEILEAYS